MPITRDFLDGNGTLPILFNVAETFEVWDGQSAIVVDHLLNHIKILNSLAEGPVDHSVVKLLAKYPHYNLDQTSYLTPAERDELVEALIEECVILLKCLTEIAPIMDIGQAERTEIFEAVRARVPFLDYHYVGDTSKSDARRED